MRRRRERCRRHRGSGGVIRLAGDRSHLTFAPAACAQAACTTTEVTAAHNKSITCVANRKAGTPAVSDKSKYCEYLKQTQLSCYCDKCACEGYTPGQNMPGTWTSAQRDAFLVNDWNDNGCIDGNGEFPCPGPQGCSLSLPPQTTPSPAASATTPSPIIAASGTGHLQASVPFFMAAALAAAVGSF